MASIGAIKLATQVATQRIQRALGAQLPIFKRNVPHPHEWHLAQCLGAIADFLEVREPSAESVLCTDFSKSPEPLAPASPATALLENEEVAL